MIQYDGKKWFYPVFKNRKLFKESFSLKSQAVIISLIFIYSVIVTWSLHYIDASEFKIDPLYFSLIGVLLTMLLVFRLNTSYDRWYEGRKQWGALVNTTRHLAVLLESKIPESEKSDRIETVKLIGAYPFLLKSHLRGEKSEYWPESVKQYIDIDHKPSNAALFGNKILQHHVEKLVNKYQLTDGTKRTIDEDLRRFLDITGACERILKTPIPFSHVFFIKNFIMLYSIAIPFGLFHFFDWYTIIATCFIAWGLIGIETVSESIEEPFGMDANDLALTHMSGSMYAAVQEVFDIYMDEEMPKRERLDWIIH